MEFRLYYWGKKQSPDTSVGNTDSRTQNSELIYDLTGRRVEHPRKGFYIVGGKKLILK